MKNVLRKEVAKNFMDELYTAKEVCAIFKISRQTLHRYMKHGYLRAIRFPGKGKCGAIRFDRKHLETFKKNGLNLTYA